LSRLLMVFALFCTVLCQSASAPAEQQETVIERQEITVRLIPAEHLLIGESRISFSAGTHWVYLRLAPAAKIESVRIAGRNSPYSFSGGLLSLQIPTEAAHGTSVVKIAYRAVFNDPLPRQPGNGEDPTYGIVGAITAEGTFLSGSAGWYPITPATPLHRSVKITAPAGTEAITAGKRVSRETAGSVSTSTWEESRPVGELTLCAGPYRIEERRLGKIDLYTYFYPDNAPLAPRYLDAAARNIAFYAKLLGPYPFEKFAVVENFFPTGYGFPSFTLLGGTVIRLPFIIDTSLPHEIAHSWWGNGVQVDERGGNWSEGLVTYLADYLLKERRSESEAREYRRRILDDYATLVPPAKDFPLTAFRSRTDPATRAIGYGKGAMVFHMIRTMIGERAFFGALREICRERLYRSASWSDFVHAFSRSAGKDLSPFRRQWLDRPGGPHLALAGVTSRREGTGWSVSGTVVQTAPPYELQLPLRLETAGASVQETLNITREHTPFRISTPVKPHRLLLDPDTELFRILAPNEIPLTVNSIKGSNRLLGVLTEDCRAGEESFRRLLASLGQEKSAIVKEDELGAARENGHDLLFCGLPAKRSLTETLPDGITLKGDIFTVQGKPVDSPDSLVFLVLPSPSKPGRFVAIYRPASLEAAATYNHKITHYGPYSFLVFADGTIRYKGTLPPTSAGNTVSFR
jgi:hypothetical protein